LVSLDELLLDNPSAALILRSSDKSGFENHKRLVRDLENQLF